MPSALRIVSFNVEQRRGESPREQEGRLQRGAEFLLGLQPDLVGLQEVTPHAWQYLQQRLPVHGMVFTPRLDGQRHGEGVPVFNLNPDLRVLARRSFWFSDTPETPSLGWRAAHPRVCSALRVGDGGTHGLWLFNLHLDHRSRLARHRSLDLLREKLRQLTDPEDRIVICGDFNMPGYRKELRRFLHQPPELRDATHLHPLGTVRPTYLGWGPFRLAKARIDLCLHSMNLQVKRYRAENPEWDGHRISDHRALVVDFIPSSSND